jgi:hypothetical protein
MAAALLATAALTAGAQATAPAASAATMNFQQLVDRVAAQGYSDVREVERESDKLYEVKARDAQGRWVELVVDARSGEILREKVKSKR